MNDAQIVELYLAGGTGKAIGRQFGVSDTAVFNSLKRQGIPRRRSGKRPDWEGNEQDRRELIAAYRSGTGITRLAQRFRINKRRVSQVLEESGVTWRHPGGKLRFSEEEAAEFARAYLAGEKMSVIARQHEVSTNVIRNYLVRAGVQLRPTGAPPFWTEERKARAVLLYEGGHQIKDIAAKMGCGRETVERTLVELGIHEKKNWTLRGENHPSWQGGRRVDAAGYVRVRVTDANRHLADGVRSGYVMEHRVVMARTLGRPLLPDENVHHKNGVRSDNSPANLELWVKHQPQGQRVDEVVEWAVTVLQRYAPGCLADKAWQEGMLL